MPNHETGCPMFRNVGIVISVSLFGIPALLFLTLISYGAILAPLGLLLPAPFILINYLLWGRYLSRDLADETTAK